MAKIGLVFLVVLMAFASPSLGQVSVVTSPVPATTAGGNASTTITATGVFQQVFAASPSSPGSASRRGCLIENNGSHNMSVTEGLALASSTTALAFLLAPGASYGCAGGGTVLVGQVNITGTIGEAFYAAQY